MDKKLIHKLEMELKPIGKTGGIYGILSSPENYNEILDQTLKIMVNELKFEGIFLSVGKNYDTIIKRFEKEKINTKKLFFIDASGNKNEKEISNCFVCNTKSLVGISLAIGQAAQSGRFKFMLMDSLSLLLIYNGLKSTQKFSHFILSKMRNMKMSSVILILNDSESQKLLPVISQFCDKVISLQ